MPTFRTLPTEINAIQYRAPDPAQDFAGNVDALARFVGASDSADAAAGVVLTQGIVNDSVPFSPARLTPAPSWNEDFKLLLWVEKGQAHVELKDLDCIIAEPDGTGFYPCALEIFRDRYEPGEVAASAKLTQRQLEDEVFGSFRITATHYCPVFFATDELLHDDDLIEQLLSEHGAAPALAAMLTARGRDQFTTEKLVELGDKISHEGRVAYKSGRTDDDSFENDPELIREDLEGTLARGAYGWLVEATTPVKMRRFPDSTGAMVTWGYTSSAWFWADSYFGCIDQVIEWAPKVIQVENPDGSQAEADAAREAADAAAATEGP